MNKNRAPIRMRTKITKAKISITVKKVITFQLSSNN